MIFIADQIEASELWDPRYNLPTIPIHNNPRIYTALVFRFMDEVPRAWVARFIDFSQKAWVERNGILVPTRWPDGRGGNYSHDEILGDAFILPGLAWIHLEVLRVAWGVYPDENGEFPVSRWFYRFIFLVPYLKARAGEKLSVFNKLAWSIHVLMSMRAKTVDADGAFKIWLMVREMKNHCPKTCARWVAGMKKRGMTPKDLFVDYLKECPSMRKFAPLEWE